MDFPEPFPAPLPEFAAPAPLPPPREPEPEPEPELAAAPEVPLKRRDHVDAQARMVEASDGTMPTPGFLDPAGIEMLRDAPESWPYFARLLAGPIFDKAQRLYLGKNIEPEKLADFGFRLLEVGGISVKAAPAASAKGAGEFSTTVAIHVAEGAAEGAVKVQAVQAPQ